MLVQNAQAVENNGIPDKRSDASLDSIIGNVPDKYPYRITSRVPNQVHINLVRV